MEVEQAARQPTNLADILSGAATIDPGRPALIFGFGDRVVSFGELAGLVMPAAGFLRTRGVGKGDRVAVVLPTGLASIVALLGAARIGAACALMNPALGRAELAALEGAVGGTSLALVGVGGEAVGAGGGTPVGVRSGAGGMAGGDQGPVIEEPTLLATLDRSEGVFGAEAVGVDPAAPAFFLFTSGTTGTPKPVPVSHDAILQRVRAYSPGVDVAVTPGARLMCTPIFHIGGLLGLLLNLWAGRPTVIQPRFDAGEWLALVERHRVESSFLVPTMLHRLLDHPDFARRDLSSLVTLSYGAAAAPVSLIARAMAALPHVGFINTFGQTETLGGYTALSPADHRDPRRAGSVGQPLAGVEVQIVRPGTEEPVSPGATGEVLVRATQNVQAGWLRTGDLAHQDADGYLFPAGRLSDTINRGGEKFAPAEVEAALRVHPKVVDAGVTGVPDPEMGERVGAVVVVDGPVTDTEALMAELRAHCRAELAPFKVPERIVLADQLPCNELGKLTRKRLAQVIVEGCGTGGTGGTGDAGGTGGTGGGSTDGGTDSKEIR